ncbi:hypothetical protein OC842_007066 [Tilletia horrida]|uniref:Cytochrome P450 n=1 Tax=Tilletia horrida TaxID=155126 RepID=A0AAN6JH20_9BASI|nr:hypothetical protein OC842_007066 [Tilletia horrida]
MTKIELSAVTLPSLGPVTLAILSIFVFGTYGLVAFLRRPYPSNLAKVPGPGVRHWFFGSFPAEYQVEGKISYYLHKSLDEYGHVCAITEMARLPVIVLADHRAVCKVLLQTPYQRVPMINDLIRRHAGAGILTAEGAEHRRQRKVAHPAFTQGSVYDMAPTMHQKGDHMVTRLNRIIDGDKSEEGSLYGTSTDISKAMTCIALDIIGAVGFNYEFNALLGDGATSDLERAFSDSLSLLTTGTAYGGARILLGDPIEQFGRFFKVEEQLHLDRSKKLVRKICAELVERAKKAESKGTDFLSLMVRANSSEEVKSSQRLTDEEMRENIPVFVFAGHETTATALSWSMLELIDERHGKSRQDRLRQELIDADEDVWKNDARALDSLPYLDAFTRETMRFHSPARGLPRQAPYDDVIPLGRPMRLRDGTMTTELHVKKGQKMIFPLSWMNRDESLWGPDGNQFKPERWLSDDKDKAVGEDVDIDPSVKELRGVWSNLATFGAGPTQCIGIRMALLEFKIAIAALVMNFEVLPPNLPGEPAIEIVSQEQLVTKPVLKSDPKLGLAMPVRIRKLVTATATASA